VRDEGTIMGEGKEKGLETWARDKKGGEKNSQVRKPLRGKEIAGTKVLEGSIILPAATEEAARRRGGGSVSLGGRGKKTSFREHGSVLRKASPKKGVIRDRVLYTKRSHASWNS